MKIAFKSGGAGSNLIGRKRSVICCLLLVACCLLPIPIVADEISTLYKNAMDSFYKKDYKSAISLWEQVLQIDPNQSPPKKLIGMARQKIAENSIPLTNEYNKFISAGDYKKASAKLDKLLEADPTSSKWNTLKEKLNKFIANAAPAITDKGKIPDLLRKSVSGYLGNEKDDRIAVLASRYAWQLDKANNITSKVFVFMDKEYTEIARLEVMDNRKTVVEQKIDVILAALNEGQNEYAAMECELAVSLEPDNLRALKLLGSAYYAQGKMAQARSAWEKALKIAPDDIELKKFMPKVK